MPTSQVSCTTLDLWYNADHSPGAMVLGHSLRDRGVKAPLVAFITVDRLAADTINELRVCTPTTSSSARMLTCADRI